MDHSTSSSSRDDGERLALKERSAALYRAAGIVGGVGIVAAIALAFLADHTLRRFFFAYLISFMFFLSIALGGLFFVILQHLVKAAWSVNVRRIAEWLGASIPVLAILATPIVVPVLLHRGELYSWAARSSAEPKRIVVGNYAKPVAEPGGDEEITGFKNIYLNPTFWTIRLIAYFTAWSLMGVWFWRRSLEQDLTGDINLTSRMQSFSPLAMTIFALTLTFAAFDLLMALDPTWSSTIFGVYYFAGCVIAIFATIIVTVVLLQRAGYLENSVSIEHFHDLGKFLFGFTFFWGYIAFSQYMLMWYSNLPEETHWYRVRGATSAIEPIDSPIHDWTKVIIIILFGHLLIPFAGLLSRHVKRNPAALAFWAVWLLLFHWVDMFWIVMPQMDGYFHFGAVEIAAFVGIGGVFLAFVLSRAVKGALRPIHDPRLEDSLEFENV